MAAALLVTAIARRSAITSTTCSIIRSKCKSPHYYYYHADLLYFSTKSLENPPSKTIPFQFTEDYFIEKYQLSPQIASKLVSDSARMKNPKNPDLVLSFLKEIGFSPVHLEKIVAHYPMLFSSSPARSVKPKLKIFHDLGFSPAETTQIISSDPTILLYQPKRIIDSLSWFKLLLGSNGDVNELIKKHGYLFYADPEKTTLPNIEFLQTCGVHIDQINSCMSTFDRLLKMSPENMRRCVHKVDEMGVERTSNMFIHALNVVSKMSDETLELKLKTFQRFGFSEDDILRWFRSAPSVIAMCPWKIKEMIEDLLETGNYDMSCIINNPTSLTHSVEKKYKPRLEVLKALERKIKEVIEVLLETGKFDMSCIRKYPRSVMRSVEKWYKPRLEVLKALERKGLINKWPTLPTLCEISDEMFFEKFVAPNINEVGKECSEWKTRNGTF